MNRDNVLHHTQQWVMQLAALITALIMAAYDITAAMLTIIRAVVFLIVVLSRPLRWLIRQGVMAVAEAWNSRHQAQVMPA